MSDLRGNHVSDLIGNEDSVRKFNTVEKKSAFLKHLMKVRLCMSTLYFTQWFVICKLICGLINVDFNMPNFQ